MKFMGDDNKTTCRDQMAKIPTKLQKKKRKLIIIIMGGGGDESHLDGDRI